MSVIALNYVNQMMQEIEVPYRFGRWEGTPPEWYCVCESYTEIPLPNKEEDGRHETTLYLRLYTRKSPIVLEEAKEKIEKHFNKTAILENGSGLAVTTENPMYIKTGDNTLHSYKINLILQEWKVN